MPIWRGATSFRACHFARHQATAKHKRATCDPAKLLAIQAPPVADFERVLAAFKKGKANGDEGIENVGKRKKLIKMKFCLAEAIRVQTRLWLRTARSMTTHSDASKGRLLVRGQMCGEDLCPRHVLLGTANLADDFESSALGVASAVVACLRDLATPMLGAPFAAAEDPDVDTDLLAHICDIVEVFNADAAADEQLAGRLLQTTNLDCNAADVHIGQIFRNLIIINKDKPHGARRITSRTWKCDPYLGKLAQEIVMGPNSIAQLLQHSDVLRGVYARHVRALQHNPVWSTQINSLSAAKHRFDTWQKPFARLCFTFDAVLATAQSIHEQRRAEASGRNAKAFLQLVDEESMLSLAMMTDAGEENLALVRYLDSEHVDKMEIAMECHRFLKRITTLFDQKGCLLTGFTAYMLELLKKERVLYIDHKPKKVGGKSTDQMAPIVQRCLGRLEKWSVLAQEVLHAEFPEFESVNAFSVFRLTSVEERREWADAEMERRTVSTKLLNLTNLLRLDVENLKERFFDHLPVAQHIFDQQGCTSFAAWKEAMDNV